MYTYGDADYEGDNNESTKREAHKGVAETVSKDSGEVKSESSQSGASGTGSKTENTASKPIRKPEYANVKLLAFTFDDAPSFSGIGDNATTQIIDALSKYGGAGTMFVNGKRIDENGVKLLEYALSKNFELGNHTYDHLNLVTLSEAAIKQQIESLNTLVKTKLNVDMRYCRPGYLAVDQKVYNVCSELRMPIIGGNKNASEGSGADWDSNTPADDIKKHIFANAYDGSIILLHSFSPQTAEIMDEVCKKLYDDGFRFVTLTQLFEYNGIDISDIPTDRVIQNVDDAIN